MRDESVEQLEADARLLLDDQRRLLRLRLLVGGGNPSSPGYEPMNPPALQKAVADYENAAHGVLSQVAQAALEASRAVEKAKTAELVRLLAEAGLVVAVERQWQHRLQSQPRVTVPEVV
jgi:hypothetical protein